MADDNTVDRERLAAERRRAFETKPKGKGSRIVIGAIMGVAFLAIAALVLAPDQVRSLLGGRTSTSETMQETSRTDSGISTEITVPDDVDTPVDVDPPMRPEPARPAADDSEYRSKIAALERQLEEMRSQSGNQVDKIRSLLDEQARALRDQFERERKAQEAEYERRLRAAREAAAADKLSEEQAAARARLEEERARREAIAHEQVQSDALVLDGGAKTAGSSSVKGGDRELSSNEEFMRSASTQSYDTVRATTIANPARTIVQGTSLAAVLETAVSTELPGIIRAVVSHDVYSYDGDNVLLPRGSRLIGTYNSDVSIAQNRAQIAWNRAVTPKGVSVELGGYGADRLGMSGQSGHVDTRFRERFGAAALISLITLGPQFIVKDGSSEGSSGTVSDAADDLTGDLEKTTQSVMADYLSLGPVIYIDQGTAISVMVNRDLVF
ncbi:TrbI/VirB10 family protein [Aurantimonas sp. 22II-16-19i]|uniref:TrbI/VirB10 family protein n=1 Tax=Aurantimonas sp. 22II-16-19i TaxID=1317114 RepID=UPI0009F7DE14|nr:TrbI/VirB10 family protein [Aurantimonas sp. 22II-16-19i]ORE97059.1 putative VirB10 protein [Aurantimonas sp. 22II-16-19i]